MDRISGIFRPITPPPIHSPQPQPQALSDGTSPSHACLVLDENLSAMLGLDNTSTVADTVEFNKSVNQQLRALVECPADEPGKFLSQLTETLETFDRGLGYGDDKTFEQNFMWNHGDVLIALKETARALGVMRKPAFEKLVLSQFNNPSSYFQFLAKNGEDLDVAIQLLGQTPGDKSYDMIAKDNANETNRPISAYSYAQELLKRGEVIKSQPYMTKYENCTKGLDGNSLIREVACAIAMRDLEHSTSQKRLSSNPVPQPNRQTLTFRSLVDATPVNELTSPRRTSTEVPPKRPSTSTPAGVRPQKFVMDNLLDLNKEVTGDSDDVLGLGWIPTQQAQQVAGDPFDFATLIEPPKAWNGPKFNIDEQMKESSEGVAGWEQRQQQMDQPFKSGNRKVSPPSESREEKSPAVLSAGTKKQKFHNPFSSKK